MDTTIDKLSNKLETNYYKLVNINDSFSLIYSNRHLTSGYYNDSFSNSHTEVFSYKGYTLYKHFIKTENTSVSKTVIYEYFSDKHYFKIFYIDFVLAPKNNMEMEKGGILEVKAEGTFKGGSINKTLRIFANDTSTFLSSFKNGILNLNDLEIRLN